MASKDNKVRASHILIKGSRRKASCKDSTAALIKVLKSIRGRPVVVKLNSGVDYRGIVLPLFFLVMFVTVLLYCFDYIELPSSICFFFCVWIYYCFNSQAESVFQ